MGSKQSLVHFLLFFLVIGLASSSHISNDQVVEPHRSIGRSILQQKTHCPVDYIRTVKYSIVVDKCKATNYTVDNCCLPLREVICPVSNQTNDPKTDCYESFFNYLNLSGKYPPGLFESLCKNDVHPLDCPREEDMHSGVVPRSSSSSLVLMIMLLVGLVMFVNI